MSDFVVDFTVRNGRIRRALREAGYENVNKFCVANGLRPSDIGLLLNLKISPINKQGHWRKSVLAMADALDCLPEDLFCASQRTLEVKTNFGSKEISESQMLRLIGNDQALQWELSGSGDPLTLLQREESEQTQVRDLVHEVNEKTDKKITSREARVLEMRFEEGLTLDAVGKQFDFTSVRARQIEASALWKMRRQASELVGRLKDG